MATDMQPLAQSFEANDVEAGLKAAIIKVWNDQLAARFDAVGLYGMPHRGTLDLLERFSKHVGLSIERRNARPAHMAEVYRAFVANNPRRGTAFAEFFLDLLLPGQWTMDRLYHTPGDPYPTVLTTTDGPGKALTSRLNLNIDFTGDTEGGSLSKAIGTVRAVLPAKFVLRAQATESLSSTMRVVTLADRGTLIENFAATAQGAIQ